VSVNSLSADGVLDYARRRRAQTACRAQKFHSAREPSMGATASGARSRFSPFG
jgi:hypothetical protein